MNSSAIFDLDGTTTLASLDVIDEENNTDVLIGDFNFEKNQVPEWVALLYYIFICSGAIVNIGIVFALLKFKHKGITLVLIQLLIVDILTIPLIIPEILLLREGSWIYSSHLCPIFLGSEVLFNCLTVYFMVCLNFHVVSLWNLNISEVYKSSKNPLTSCSEDDSNECLVKKNDSPSTSRTINIDYRTKKTDISIALPSIFVWFVCVSLSIPQHILATTLKLNTEVSNATLCTVIDTHYGDLLQYFLLAFKVLIPLFLLTVSFVLLLIKLYQSRRTNTVENTLSNNLISAQKLVVFCLIVSLAYLVTSTPRNTLFVMHTIANESNITSAESLKIPPLYNLYVSDFQNCLLTMLYYCAVPLRSVIIGYFFLPLKDL